MHHHIGLSIRSHSKHTVEVSRPHLFRLNIVRGFAIGQSSKGKRSRHVEVGVIEPAAVVATGTQGKSLRAKTSLTTCYSQLAKARLSALVVVSSGAGFMLAGAPIAVDSLIAVTMGTALQAAAANTFNQVYEIKTDAMMNRTMARPLPSGRISRQHALAFGAANAVAGTAILGAFCNPLTAALGVSNVFLYSCIYTPMKQMSIYNTWVGAVVGAIPPLMGYAAATGTVASAEAAILSAGLFFWQFPHFFSLAWLSKKDYSAGGHKMVPCFDQTGAATGRLLTRYSAALATLPVLSYSLGITSVMFPLESLAFNGYLLYASHKFTQSPSMSTARTVFRSSLWYLPLFMGLMIFHKNEWSDPDGRSSLALSSMSKGGSAPVVTSESSSIEQQHMQMQSMNTIEGALRCAKAYMKSMCIHEIMVPPLTRSKEDDEAPKQLQQQQQATPLCPVSQANKALQH